MDLKSNESSAVQGTVNANGMTKPVISNAPAAVKPADKPKPVETPKVEAKKADTPSVSPAPVVEPVKEAKPPMSIDEKLKVLELLQVRKSQYENLLKRMTDLDAFEFDLMEDADELQENHFAGCKIIVMDTRNSQFVTTTPNLVKMVVGFLKAACLDKKNELENLIVFPDVA